MYVLSNDKGQYICKDRFKRGGSIHETFSITTNITLAETWDDREKALNTANNSLSKTLRNKGFRVVRLENQNCQAGNLDVHQVQAGESHDLSEEELQELLEDVFRISRLINDVKGKTDALSGALRRVDKEITDIHHWIELNKLNAYQGYKASAILQKKLKQRRIIKNGMAILRAMSGVEVAVSNMENANYRPRVLNELFED